MNSKVFLGSLMLGTLVLAGCSSNNDSAPQSGATCTYQQAKSAAKEVKLPDSTPPQGEVKLKLSTNAGDINMQLNADQAPCTVGAITSLAKQGYYDNTVCHRLTTQGIYVLQCGDAAGTGAGGPGFRFADEYPIGTGVAGLYKAGTIAMANAGPNTNGSQFFLNYEDSPLPPNYTLFGTMDEKSLQVVRDIAKKGTANGKGDGQPKEEVKILKAEVK